MESGRCLDATKEIKNTSWWWCQIQTFTKKALYINTWPWPL